MTALDFVDDWRLLSAPEVCKHLEVSEATWHRWQSQYGGMKSADATRRKELEKLLSHKHFGRAPRTG